MAAEAKHRDAIVTAAAGLFRERGYSATGMNDIVAASGAPKGSLYHYFPAGKAQLGAAAVTLAGGAVASFMQSLAEQTDSSSAFLRAYGHLVGEALAQSGFRLGCPISTVLLENAPQEEAITQAGRDVIAQWAGIVAGVLERDGVQEATAHRLASLTIALIQGALLQSRVAQSIAPLQLAIDHLQHAFAASQPPSDG